MPNLPVMDDPAETSGKNRADVRKPTRVQNLKTDFMKRLFRMLLTASGLLVFVGGGAGRASAAEPGTTENRLPEWALGGFVRPAAFHNGNS